MSGGKKSRILTAARSVFLRFGYKRANMNDIAEVAGVSRPALYVLFKNKEEIFIGVYLQWVDETLSAVKAAMALDGTPAEKIERAFDIWSVRPFKMTMDSQEAQELVECGFGFAEASLRQGYAAFEAAITPGLAPYAAIAGMPAARMAHVLASAVRGFKQTATTADELCLLIKDLLQLTCRPS